MDSKETQMKYAIQKGEGYDRDTGREYKLYHVVDTGCGTIIDSFSLMRDAKYYRDLWNSEAARAKLWYNNIMKQDYKQACKAIEARDPKAYSIVQHGNNNFSARVGCMTAYYVIIDDVITGDVWYE